MTVALGEVKNDAMPVTIGIALKPPPGIFTLPVKSMTLEPSAPVDKTVVCPITTESAAVTIDKANHDCMGSGETAVFEQQMIDAMVDTAPDIEPSDVVDVTLGACDSGADACTKVRASTCPRRHLTAPSPSARRHVSRRVPCCTLVDEAHPPTQKFCDVVLPRPLHHDATVAQGDRQRPAGVAALAQLTVVCGLRWCRVARADAC